MTTNLLLFFILTLISNFCKWEKDITLHLCENCSYRSKDYANQESPHMRCKSPNPNQEMTLEMNLLYRRKSNYSIHKAITSWFLIGYHNQGLPAFNLAKDIFITLTN